MGWNSLVLIDDSVFMRKLLRHLVEELKDCVVVGEGSNGYDAINQARMHKPDVMMLDVSMPLLNGSDAVSEVLKASPKTKIVMVTALGQQTMVVDAIRQGAKDFLTKPYDKDKVHRVIGNIINIKDGEEK